jgi:hypothetical protein
MSQIDELLRHLRDELTPLQDGLKEVQASLHLLLQERMSQDWYTPSELAVLLGKSDYTMREWCRLGQIHAQKPRHE